MSGYEFGWSDPRKWSLEELFLHWYTGVKPMSQHPMETLYGDEFAPMLIKARIPFRAQPAEYETVFFVDVEHLKEALDLMMQLRASKL